MRDRRPGFLACNSCSCHTTPSSQGTTRVGRFAKIAVFSEPIELSPLYGNTDSIPVTNRSGCPGGQTTETLHPWRMSATAKRADSGHHIDAHTSTTGPDFSLTSTTLLMAIRQLGQRSPDALGFFSTIARDSVPADFPFWGYKSKQFRPVNQCRRGDLRNTQSNAPLTRTSLTRAPRSRRQMRPRAKGK